MQSDSSAVVSLSSSTFSIVSGLAEGQVLQQLGTRGAAVRISGTALQPGPVFATIYAGPKKTLRGWNRRRVGAANRRKFTARLTSIPVGGPYRLELACGETRAVIREFFVGDVWLLAGQSNMEGIGNRAGAAKPHPLIRSFSMRREWRLATEPLHVVAESPDVCHHGGRQLTHEEAENLRRTTQKGVGPGLFFAHDMLKRSGVPQGLICVAHGGTCMRQWDPGLKTKGGESLYASAFASLRATGQPISGVLWYQGESDANPPDAQQYTERMKKLVAAVRRDLRAPRLPWVTVQIARVNGPRSAVDVAAWNSIQEQQRLLPDAIPALETVSAVDLSQDDGIHISAQDYPRLAARMARAATRMTYGDRSEKRPPQLRGVSISSDAANNGGWWVDVHFEHVVGALKALGKPNGFAVIDAEGRDLNAIYHVTLQRSTARLHVNLPQIDGLRLHHGLGTFPYCNITDDRDEALPVFGPLTLSVP
jgi:Carbohydrate esterase, sialic acid-specific acetylesterase